MNEGHESGYAPDYDAHGYDPYSTGSYQTVGTVFADDAATGAYPYIPQQQRPQPYDPGHGYGYPQGQDSNPPQQQTYEQQPQRSYDPYAYAPAHSQAQPDATAAYATGTYATGSYDTGTYDTYDTGAYDTGTYPAQQPYQAYEQAYDPYPSAAYEAPAPAAAQPSQDWDSGAYPTYSGYGYAYGSEYSGYGYAYGSEYSGYGYGYDASGDTGVYEQVPPPYEAPAYQASPYDAAPQRYDVPAYRADPAYAADAGPTGTVADSAPDAAADTTSAAGAGLDPDLDLDLHLDLELDAALYAESARVDPDDEPVRHDYAVDGPGTGEPVARSRRRKPAKRSALLTVAVPSVAVMGVAAVGAAAVTGVGMAASTTSTTSSTQADATGTAPTTQLDRQLAGVSRDADDFASRASRSQERLDLKERQAAAKQAAAAAAARKEALRPKFVLPVKQKGLSAYFGQAGVNWMALHTGIDFPVQEGTPVMAATDGSVRTQWNPSYGNMAIVTAPDGTETWYCHLSSTKIRSGKVKAGTVIAYSGNTGNTTGPHLHFEVRPGGGSPIDPLPWLLAHGLDPR